MGKLIRLAEETFSANDCFEMIILELLDRYYLDLSAGFTSEVDLCSRVRM